MSDPTIDFQIQTDMTQFKVPTEMIKKNFKTIQKLVEKQKKQVTAEIAGIKKNANIPPAVKLEMIRKVIRGFETFQKRLKAAVKKDEDYRSRLVARIQNLGELANYTAALGESKKDGEISDDNDKLLDLHDSRLLNWYRDRTNLLIIDYLIKSNVTSQTSVGLKLLQSLSNSNPNYLKLIDYDLYENFNKIFVSIIHNHDLLLVSSWFDDNRSSLKKISSNLEFEINYCKFLSLIEEGKLDEAIKFSKANLSSSGNKSNYQPHEVEIYQKNLQKLKEMGGLLVYLSIQPDLDSQLKSSIPSYSGKMVQRSQRFQDYEKLLSGDRWIGLSECFINDFTQLYGISKNYPLFVYLSAGLSSLKTKSCFCNNQNTIFVKGNEPRIDPQVLKDRKYRGPNYYYRILNKINNCPVCLPELYRLSRNLPYAQLITDIFNNPFKLPNGNIYSMDKLTSINHTSTARAGKIVDPLTKEEFNISDCVRVYPA